MTTNRTAGGAAPTGDDPGTPGSVQSGRPRLEVVWSGTRQSRLLPKSYFLEWAHYEQLRAVRSGSKVSLVVVSSAPTSGVSPEDLYDLSKALQPLIRETDQLGWYAPNAIAILLPDTGEEGARDCAMRIEQLAARRRFSIETLTYPQASLVAGDDPKQTPLLLSPQIEPEAPRFTRGSLLLKRALDVFGAVVGIVMLSPVMLAVAIAVKATSKGPIIFKQIRLGKGGKPFVFLKFRSMKADADQSVHRAHVEGLIKARQPEGAGEHKAAWFKMNADPRITPFGRFIRKTSLDELPQLFNVLRGDMSLVGPRPPIPYETESYSAWHLRRILEVKPGVTGLWQAEARGASSFDDMVRLDLQYSRNWSLGLDLKILLKTVKVVFQGRGAG